MPDLYLLVLQIAVVLVTCQVIGQFFQIIHQPRVVGEMFAGILLGPSVLGWLAPGLSAFLFPPTSLGYLNALSQIGLLIFMFLVGLEMNLTELKGARNATFLTSHASITIPFVLGSLLGLFLYPRLSDDSVSFVNFSVFIGAAMSITAFPVLARILRELGMLGSRLGTVAIACAAIDDVTGWCVLAYIILLVRAGHGGMKPWITLLGVLSFSLIMIYAVRPFLRRVESAYLERGKLGNGSLAFLMQIILLAAFCTERLGIHLLFGAFLTGAIMPRNKQFVRYLSDLFEPITVTLLLPLFFAFTGLRTNIGLLENREMWMYCGIIVLVATGGKMGGSMLASWISGMGWREAVGLGALMNTRGLMELIILNIGLDIKVISPALFSMMVLMALFATFMTTPVLKIIYRQNRQNMVSSAEAISAGERLQPAVASADTASGSAA